MEEETIGNQAFVLAIMGNRFSNTQRQSGRIRRSVYDGFHIGPECYFTTGAWGYICFCFLCWGIISGRRVFSLFPSECFI